MKFGIPNETYHCVAYSKSGRFISQDIFSNNIVKISKKFIIEWGKRIAKIHSSDLGHISVCRESTSEIMRYTPSGAISCLSK